MRVTSDGKVEKTDDDLWCILTRYTDSERLTVVGPYVGIGGVARAEQDGFTWRRDDANLRAVVCRMLPPAEFETRRGKGDGRDSPLFGYSANLFKTGGRYRFFEGFAQSAARLHQDALSVVSILMERGNDPAPDTREGRALAALAEAVERYERATLPAPFGEAGETGMLRA